MLFQCPKGANTNSNDFRRWMQGEWELRLDIYAFDRI